MNYFGMFFTYMIPGIVIGIIVAAAFAECGRHRRRSASRKAALQAKPRGRVSEGSGYSAAAPEETGASPVCAPERIVPSEAARKKKLYVCTLSEDAA